ncbi:InlB B-repeat-containing protein [Streptomyces sp. SBC-4]|nr:zinc-dependent metalloprotease family protein [Streptomyces sp. SBC-4]MDV5142907.1 InlB B-repeat-containing protein [Streptomyces sp. SBC-4]
MARYRWTGGVALGAMVLGVTTMTGFAPARDGGQAGASGTAAQERNVRDAVEAGALSPDTGERITASTRPPTNTGADTGRRAAAGDAAEAFGAQHVRGRVARVMPAALAPVCGSGYGQEVTFPLFGDVTVQAVEEARSTIGSTLVWHGTVAGTVDQNVVVTLDGGCDKTPGNEILSAQFLLGGDLYAIEPLGPGRVTVAQLTPLTDEDEQPTGAPPAAAIAAEAATGRKPAAGPRAEAEDDTRTTLQAAAAACKGGKGFALIDTLVGYTPGARTEAGGDAQIKALAAKGIALANDAFSSSGTKVRLRLVGTAPVTVAASMDGVTNKLLGALALPADGIADNIPKLRDQYGADLVSVIAAGRAAGGLGYTPPDPGPSTAAWGYSVVGRGAIGNYSMGHEIGHNLSADHDRVTQPVQPENGATGYFPAKGDWSSLMAYESSCRKATKGACTRINHFSNPKQKYRGEPIGIPLGKPDQADSADVLSKTGMAVAAYRAAKTSDSMCAVTSSVSPAGGGSVQPALPGPYPQGTSTVHSAVAAKGYVFSGWKLDGKAVAGGATGFRVPAGDHTLVALFKKGTTPTSTVTTKTTGSGTVKKAPAKRAEQEGADVLYEAVPAAGWDFAGWRLDGSSAGDDDTVAIDVGTADMELTAVFEQRRHALKVECEGGSGTVSLSQDGPYSDGDTVLATAVPDPGYVFVDWLLDGEPHGGDEERSLGETAVGFDEEGHTLTAVFARA